MNREWQRFSLSNMQQKKRSKKIEMIIKMVNEFNSPSSILHAQTRCWSMHACGFIAGQKHCEKSGLGHRAFGPTRAVGRRPLGRRGTPGLRDCRVAWLRAAGPSRAVSRGPASSETPWKSCSWNHPIVKTLSLLVTDQFIKVRCNENASPCCWVAYK